VYGCMRHHQLASDLLEFR